MTSPGEWIQFFENAKIPHPGATKYGVAFAENRISMSMLDDLNKVEQSLVKIYQQLVHAGLVLWHFQKILNDIKF